MLVVGAIAAALIVAGCAVPMRFRGEEVQSLDGLSPDVPVYLTAPNGRLIEVSSYNPIDFTLVDGTVPPAEYRWISVQDGQFRGITWSDEKVTFPTSDVKSVQVTYRSVGRTVGVVAIVVGGVAVAIVAVIVVLIIIAIVVLLNSSGSD